MGEDEIVRLFNAKIKLERKQYKKRVLQLAPERIYQRAYQIFYARWMGKGDSFQLELENSMDTGIKEIGLLLEQEETEAA